MGFSSAAIPVLIVIPIIPAFGILFLLSIIKYVYYNKKLFKSGQITKAQIVEKYERGSKDYYKTDDGKMFIFVCQWISSINHIDNNQEIKQQILCESKFVNIPQIEYEKYNDGDYINIIYLPSNYKKYFNLEILNANTIKLSTIIVRSSIAIILIFIIPILISSLTQEWQLFVFPILISFIYSIIIYYGFIYFCEKKRNKTWFQNKSFKHKKATSEDIQRFQIMGKNNDTNDDDTIVNNVVDSNSNNQKDRDNKTRKKSDDKKVSLLSAD